MVLFINTTERTMFMKWVPEKDEQAEFLFYERLGYVAVCYLFNGPPSIMLNGFRWMYRKERILMERKANRKQLVRLIDSGKTCGLEFLNDKKIGFDTHFFPNKSVRTKFINRFDNLKIV